MIKKTTILLSFILLGIIINAQELQKVENGIIIKGIKYLEKDFKVEFTTFTIDSITIEIGQVFGFTEKLYFGKAIIQTKSNNILIDELYYNVFEPVGSYYGICFSQNQIINGYIIGSKYGDYDGEILIINASGKIQRESGGNYFTTKNKNYLISDWHSDMTGLTVYDLREGKVIYSKELPAYLSGWYENKNKFYSVEWDTEKAVESNIVYEFDIENLKVVKTKINLSDIQQFQKVELIGCYKN